jgi:peptide/nickel transport system substrate-binding protein
MHKSGRLGTLTTRAALSLLASTMVLGLGLGLSLGTPAGASGGDGQFGSYPSNTGTPITGGTLTTGGLASQSPNYIFPIEPATNTNTSNALGFNQVFWRLLWFGVTGENPQLDYGQSIAGPPKFSDDNKTITITLYPNWKWSDGTPITSQDVAFYIDLVKAAVATSPDDYGNYTPGQFPDNVSSVTTPNASTIIINFTQSYNQSFAFLDQLSGIQPLPAQAWAKTSANGPIVDFTNPANAKAIYAFLSGQAGDLATYATNPLWQVVDGAYKISYYDPATGANDWVANESYTGPQKPRITHIDNLEFTSVSSEFNQLLEGNLDIGFVDPSDLPQTNKLHSLGYDVWGAPNFGFQYDVYNFKDKTGDFDNVVNQLYFRQAMAHLENEPALIKSKGVFDGAAGLAYGPVPAAPVSPFTPKNALNNPYPYSISAASKLLSSHGWKVVPNGTTTCVKPGTGSGECGAGITKGLPLTFNFIYATGSPVTESMDEVLASNAKEIGINLKLSAKTFNYMTANLSDASNPSNDNSWAIQNYGGFTDGTYPTTNEIFNTTGALNNGGFSNAAVNKAINNSAYSSNKNAVGLELALITKLQPAVFQPVPDEVYAFKKTVHGAPDAFTAQSEVVPEFEYLYFTKK